jgi:amino acid transporter
MKELMARISNMYCPSCKKKGKKTPVLHTGKLHYQCKVCRYNYKIKNFKSRLVVSAILAIAIGVFIYPLFWKIPFPMNKQNWTSQDWLDYKVLSVFFIGNVIVMIVFKFFNLMPPQFELIKNSRKTN